MWTKCVGPKAPHVFLTLLFPNSECYGVLISLYPVPCLPRCTETRVLLMLTLIGQRTRSLLWNVKIWHEHQGRRSSMLTLIGQRTRSLSRLFYNTFLHLDFKFDNNIRGTGPRCSLWLANAINPCFQIVRESLQNLYWARSYQALTKLLLSSH